MRSGEPARELPVVEELLGHLLRVGLELRLAALVEVRAGRGGRLVTGGAARGGLEELAAEATLDRIVLDLLSAKGALLHCPDLAPTRAASRKLPSFTGAQYATAPGRM